MTDQAGSGPAPWRRSALSAVMIALMAFELLALYSGLKAAEWAVDVLVLALPVIGLPFLRAREAYLFSLCALLTLAAVIEPHRGVETVLEGLKRAGYLASFILLMGLLREAAISSPAVGTCGHYVTQQPPQRRFVAVFAGSHFFSVLINLGALSLLAPIIQRGVRGGRAVDQPLDEIGRTRERRQLSAALRGFAWFLVWAPTAVTQAVLPVLIPGIDPWRLIGIGLVLAGVMLLVSWAEDTLRWLPLKRRLTAQGALPTRDAVSFPSAAFGRLALVCLALFGLTVIFKLLGGVTIVSGVMLTAPIILVGWIWAQHRERAAAVEQLRDVALVDLPGGVREACSLAAAGYIGTLAARLVPLDRLDLTVVDGLPAWAVMSLLSILVWAGGQVALSPITMAVFLGSLVAAWPDGQLPIDPTRAALAIAAGTAICSTGAPFASGVLMLARASGHSGVTLAWRWNAGYTAVVSLVLVAFYFALTGGT
ncbi:MAG: hypothetical protein AAF495_28935 [Pseudomonadota bacterium]